MRSIVSLSIAASATFVPAYAFAQSADLLACVDSGYTAEEQTTIDNYVSEYSIDDNSKAQALGQALGRRAKECAGEEAARNTLMMLAQYKFAGLSEDGIKATSPDIVAVVKRIDDDLKKQKKERFMALFEKMVFGNAGSAADSKLNAEEAAWFEKTLTEAPVGATDEQAELIGALLAARILRAKAKEQLAGT